MGRVELINKEWLLEYLEAKICINDYTHEEYELFIDVRQYGWLVVYKGDHFDTFQEIESLYDDKKDGINGWIF